MKTLVVYYSQARGNTKRIADMIVEETGFDAVRIDTVVPYTGTKSLTRGRMKWNANFNLRSNPLKWIFPHMDAS